MDRFYVAILTITEEFNKYRFASSICAVIAGRWLGFGFLAFEAKVGRPTSLVQVVSALCHQVRGEAGAGRQVNR